MRANPRFSPLTIVGLLLVAGGVGWAAVGRRGPSATDGCSPEPCPASSAHAPAPEAPPTMRADAVCPSAGYLCAPLEGTELRVERWRPLQGPLVVHVPVPDFEDAELARRLQQAAMNGIRAWNDEPFPILIDLRGARTPHLTVRWQSSLPGLQIGAARTRWSSVDGLTVEALELATRDPRDSTIPLDPGQVRLTAAHEMGHALGLPHSDAPRDVMYPTNTATSVTARDRRTMEVLYEIADGTLIVR